jgi:hypothetical protein
LQLFTESNILLLIIIIVIIMQAAMKDHLWYRGFYNKQEVEIAIREWLRVQKSGFYREGLFKVI